MSFSVNVTPVATASRPGFKGSGNTKGMLIVFAIVFIAFCFYDYSPYGYGYVAEALGQMQRWVQSTVGGFRIKSL